MAFFEYPPGALHQAGFLMFINLLNPHKNSVRIDCPGSTGEVTCPRLPIWGVPELGRELRSV